MTVDKFEILLADDNERVRSGIRALIESEPQFNVIAEARDGREAIVMAERHMPDLVLMDINMPEINGFEATRIIKQELPYVRVVMLSVSDDAADLFEAIRNGAQGYLVKSLQPSDWIAYLHGILDGDAPVSRTVAERLLAEFQTIHVSNELTDSDLNMLTSREVDVLKQVSTGASNREIASLLFISENTVKNHLKNIMAKLHIRNRVQLATYARDKMDRIL